MKLDFAQNSRNSNKFLLILKGNTGLDGSEIPVYKTTNNRRSIIQSLQRNKIMRKKSYSCFTIKNIKTVLNQLIKGTLIRYYQF